MFDRSEPRSMGKRATLEVGGETLRRVPVFELPDGEREIPVPWDRLRSFDSVEELPGFAEVVHSGYQYEAELFDDGDEAFYVFDIENY